MGEKHNARPLNRNDSHRRPMFFVGNSWLNLFSIALHLRPIAKSILLFTGSLYNGPFNRFWAVVRIGRATVGQAKFFSAVKVSWRAGIVRVCECLRAQHRRHLWQRFMILRGYTPRKAYYPRKKRKFPTNPQ